MPTAEKDAADKSYVSKGLDREVIVRAALDSIDRNGSQGLTMRGLAQDLGVEAMSLYRYVAGREDLLEAVVAVLLEGAHRSRRAARPAPGRAICRLSLTPCAESPSSTPPPFRWSPPDTRRRRGCGRRCGAWSWSRTSCPP